MSREIDVCLLGAKQFPGRCAAPDCWRRSAYHAPPRPTRGQAARIGKHASGRSARRPGTQRCQYRSAHFNAVCPRPRPAVPNRHWRRPSGCSGPLGWMGQELLELLTGLDGVRQCLRYHPEQDALYHCLQVFDLARGESLREFVKANLFGSGDKEACQQ